MTMKISELLHFRNAYGLEYSLKSKIRVQYGVQYVVQCGVHDGVQDGVQWERLGTWGTTDSRGFPAPKFCGEPDQKK